MYRVEFSKWMKTRSFWVIALIQVVATFLMLWFGKEKASNLGEAFSAIAHSSTFLMIFAVVPIAQSDSENGTLRNYLLAGTGRGSIFRSKLFAACLAGFLLLLLDAVVVLCYHLIFSRLRITNLGMDFLPFLVSIGLQILAETLFAFLFFSLGYLFRRGFWGYLLSGGYLAGCLYGIDKLAEKVTLPFDLETYVIPYIQETAKNPMPDQTALINMAVITILTVVFTVMVRVITSGREY